MASPERRIVIRLKSDVRSTLGVKREVVLAEREGLDSPIITQIALGVMLSDFLPDTEEGFEMLGSSVLCELDSQMEDHPQMMTHCE